MANSGLTKNLSDYIPVLADQGIPNVTGAYAPGVSVQIISGLVTASSPQTITFATQGLSDMADANYVVLGQNQTDPADEATFTSKAVGSFVMTGPDASDVVDIVIIGKLKGQLS